jgi:hypothetical protein
MEPFPRRSVPLLVTCLARRSPYLQRQEERWNNRREEALSGRQEEKSMAKAAQQTGRASGQPKARDTTPQSKTDAGNADKQKPSADDASDNLAGFQSSQFETPSGDTGQAVRR